MREERVQDAVVRLLTLPYRSLLTPPVVFHLSPACAAITDTTLCYRLSVCVARNTSEGIQKNQKYTFKNTDVKILRYSLVITIYNYNLTPLVNITRTLLVRNPDHFFTALRLIESDRRLFLPMSEWKRARQSNMVMLLGNEQQECLTRKVTVKQLFRGPEHLER